MHIISQNFDIDVPCVAGDKLKVYSVPHDYSPDGLYVSLWRHGDMEPVPACYGHDALLLADLSITESNGMSAASGFRAEGVEIHA